MASGRTFLVVANEWDSSARRFAERYRTHGVQLLTPRDLSRGGWSYSLGKERCSQAVGVNGSLAVSGIHGVLTRLPSVREQDVLHILPGDRAYVAAEMNAFLLAWLTVLSCRVLNRPTPNCLSGPCWPHEQWVRLAYRLGVPISAVRRCIHLDRRRKKTTATQSGGTTITLVGRKHIGDADSVLITHARDLAQAARTDLLAVRFTGPDQHATFVEATLWPDIDEEQIGNAVLEYLEEERPGRRSVEEAA